MSKFISRHSNWDEFRWEQEIRKDERRISGYFRELAACLDLPDEEELIYGQLASRSDLVPSAAAGNEALREWLTAHGDDIDDEEERPHRTPGSTPVDDIDLLCSEWNLLCATRLRADLARSGMGTSCGFAKLLARSADFTEPECNCSAAMLISLGKRALADLNKLAGDLEQYCQLQKSLAPDIAFFISRLGQVREALIGKLAALRENPQS